MTTKSRRRSRQIKGFGLVLIAALAIGALVASSASALSYSKPGQTFTAKWNPFFIGQTGTTIQVRCEKGGSGSGSFTSGTTVGTNMTMNGCKTGAGSVCHSLGEPASSERIVLSSLKGNLIYLDAAHTKFGILYEPSSGTTVADFTCAAGLVRYTWTGSVISRITSPAVNVEGVTIKQAFETTSGGGQKYVLIEEDPFQGVYSLLSKTNSEGGTGLALSSSTTVDWSMSGGGRFLP